MSTRRRHATAGEMGPQKSAPGKRRWGARPRGWEVGGEETRDRRGRGAAALFLLFALGTQTSCRSPHAQTSESSTSTAPATPATAETSDSAETQEAGPRTAPERLRDLLPAAAISWAVRLHPRRLLSDARLVNEFQSILPPARLSAFRAATGIDLHQVQELWFAGYPLGTLLILDASSGEENIISAFMTRAQSVSRENLPQEEWVEITAVVDQRPQALVAKKKSFVAIADGDPSLAKIVRAHAEGQLKARASALQLSLMRPLTRTSSDSSAALYLFGPFERATDPVVQGLAAGMIELEHRDGRLMVDLRARGLWPADSKTIDAWIRSLLSTPELGAWGLDRPLEPSTTSCLPEDQEAASDLTRCRSRWIFSVADLAKSAYLLTQASLVEILTAGDEKLTHEN